MPEHIEINRRMWDERAPAHAASPEYALARFEVDPTFLSDVVRFDVPRLGDISGLHGVLQCHIGTDTLSLTRLGATMSGLDFTTPSTCSGRAGTTWSSPGSGPWAGCPTSRAGVRS